MGRLFDPEGHALLDSMGRRLASQARPIPLTATVVVGFVQPYEPAPATSPLARTARPVIAGAGSSPPPTLPDQFPLQPTPPDQPASWAGQAGVVNGHGCLAHPTVGAELSVVVDA
jgi:hypothetical protein